MSVKMCENCLFYYSEKSLPKGQGACRRYPPIAHPFMAQGIGGPQLAYQVTFPMVQNEWLCGEYQPGPVKPQIVRDPDSPPPITHSF